MSILPFDFSQTLAEFACPESFTAYEMVGQYVRGEWVMTKENERTIDEAILLDVEEEILEILSEGNLVDEAYSIMFAKDYDEFFIMDQNNANVQNKQTYVVIDGKEFIVKRNPKTAKNSNFRSYYAIKYKDIANG